MWIAVDENYKLLLFFSYYEPEAGVSIDWLAKVHDETAKTGLVHNAGGVHFTGESEPTLSFEGGKDGC